LGLARVVVEDVCFDGTAVVVAVRPRVRERDRCPHCRRRCPGYDLGEGRRRWRALDLGTIFAYVEAEAPRVHCRRHGVVVAAVPWARHGSWFTRAFEDQCAWLAVNASASAVAQLMRTSWRAVGAICRRVSDEARAQRDLLADLRRLGFDEISVRKGQNYLTVVVDHHSGRLVWAAPAATARRSNSSSTCWASSAAPGSSWCPATWPSGSCARSPSAAPTRPSVWIRFTS
jgi:transposase